MLTVNFDIIGLKDGERILDLGCGEGRHTHAMFAAANCHAVGVDLGYADVAKTREAFWYAYGVPPLEDQQWSLSVADALRLPFPDASFDKVICSEVLEHIPDYEAALDEIYRILKPGGVFAASVPRAWPEKICWALSEDYHNEPGGHVRIFKASGFKNDIEKRGFKAYARHWAHALHSPYWWLRCAFYDTQDTNKAVALYKRFLEWDLLDAPWLTRTLEKLLNPLMGKSVVFYFRKGA